MKIRYLFIIIFFIILTFTYFFIASNSFSTLEDLIENEYKSQQVEIFSKRENEALLFVLSKDNNQLKSLYVRKKIIGWQIASVSPEINLIDLKKGPKILPNKILFKPYKNRWVIYGVTPSDQIKMVRISGYVATLLPFNAYFTGHEEKKLTIWYLITDEPLNANNIDYK